METSLPGTILGDSPGALDVAKYRTPQVVELAKQQVAVQQKQAAEKQAAVKAATGKDILPVFDPDQPEYAALVEAQRTAEADALRQMDTNPGNPNFDVSNPASPVSQQLKRGWDAITQYQYSSSAKGKQWQDFVSKFNPATDSIDDWNEMKAYTHASPLQHFKGEVKQPVLLGNYAPEAVYNDAVSKLMTDQTAYAKKGEPGYLIEGTEEVLSDKAVQEAAFNIAHEPRQAKSISIRIAAMPEKQRAQLIKDAEANGKTPVEWLTWLDMDQKAGTKTTRGIKSDPTYMWGKGLENDMSKASLFVEQGRGFESGDLEGGVDIKDTWLSGGNDQGSKGINMPKAKVWNVWNNLNFGVKYDDKGNPINMPIKGVLKSGDKLAVVYEDPTYALPKGNEPKFKVQRPEEVENDARYKMTPWMDEAEFNTEVIGKIPDANKGILPSKDVITYAQDQYKAIKGKEGNIDLQSGGGKPTANKIADKYKKPEVKKGNYE